MNRLLNVPAAAVRAFSSSSRNLKNKVPEAQKLFQEDNGLPVHIKGGTSDVLLYRATMLLTAAASQTALIIRLVVALLVLLGPVLVLYFKTRRSQKSGPS